MMPPISRPLEGPLTGCAGAAGGGAMGGGGGGGEKSRVYSPGPLPPCAPPGPGALGAPAGPAPGGDHGLPPSGGAAGPGGGGGMRGGGAAGGVAGAPERRARESAAPGLRKSPPCAGPVPTEKSGVAGSGPVCRANQRVNSPGPSALRGGGAAGGATGWGGGGDIC
jgi:hypothetical protein